MILKRSKDFWFHELWINKRGNPIFPFRTIMKIRIIFGKHLFKQFQLCVCVYVFFLLEFCIQCSRCLCTVLALISICWINFVDNSNIECYLNGSWVSISTAFPSYSHNISETNRHHCFLVRMGNPMENYSSFAFPLPLRGESEQWTAEIFSQCYGRT